MSEVQADPEVQAMAATLCDLRLVVTLIEARVSTRVAAGEEGLALDILRLIKDKGATAGERLERPDRRQRVTRQAPPRQAPRQAAVEAPQRQAAPPPAPAPRYRPLTPEQVDLLRYLRDGDARAASSPASSVRLACAAESLGINRYSSPAAVVRRAIELGQLTAA